MLGLVNKRKERGYTQTELSRLIGVKQSTLSQWEIGTRCPNIPMLKKLAEVLDCTVDELLKDAPARS